MTATSEGTATMTKAHKKCCIRGCGKQQTMALLVRDAPRSGYPCCQRHGEENLARWLAERVRTDMLVTLRAQGRI